MGHIRRLVYKPGVVGLVLVPFRLIVVCIEYSVEVLYGWRSAKARSRCGRTVEKE